MSSTTGGRGTEEGTLGLWPRIDVVEYLQGFETHTSRMGATASDIGISRFKGFYLEHNIGQ